MPYPFPLCAGYPLIAIMDIDGQLDNCHHAAGFMLTKLGDRVVVTDGVG